jgi:hypothetical protein
MRKIITRSAIGLATLGAVLGVTLTASASTPVNRSLLYDVPCVEIGHVVWLSSSGTVPSQDYTWCRLVEVLPAYLGEVRLQAPNGVWSDVYRPVP